MGSAWKVYMSRRKVTSIGIEAMCSVSVLCADGYALLSEWIHSKFNANIGVASSSIRYCITRSDNIIDDEHSLASHRGAYKLSPLIE